MTSRSTPIPYPPRIELANTPTPLQRLTRLGDQLGLELYVKRDDYTGLESSGNKIRKLEFLLADALNQGADTVITCGGEQSNHCRATAAAAIRAGLKCKLILKCADPSQPPDPTGNILLDKLFNAEITWASPEEYANQSAVFERLIAETAVRGGLAYPFRSGGSTPMGAWGYIRGLAELMDDLAALPGGDQTPTTVIHASGSGGTSAGLIIGAKLLGFTGSIVGVAVDDYRPLRDDIVGICRNVISEFNLNLPFDPDKDLNLLADYVGRGYALSRPEELKFIRDLAGLEGLVLDPVYTGKAFYGLVEELKKNPDAFGRRVVFIHTGGLFGLFPKWRDMAGLLG